MTEISWHLLNIILLIKSQVRLSLSKSIFGNTLRQAQGDYLCIKLSIAISIVITFIFQPIFYVQPAGLIWGDSLS
jgi:hypothetical protein